MVSLKGRAHLHSNETAVIEVSSTFRRSFIEFFVAMHEFFVVMHEFFDELYIPFVYFFKN